MRQHLDIDFATSCQKYSPSGMMLFFILMLLLLGSTIYYDRALKAEIDGRSGTDVANITPNRHDPLPSLEHSLQLAHETENSLNLQWESQFGALEQAQVENPEIRLLSIQPNLSRSEIALTGESPNFNSIVKYIDSLRNQPALGDAVLVNQRKDTVETDKSDAIEFTISVGWKK